MQHLQKLSNQTATLVYINIFVLGKISGKVVELIYVQPIAPYVNYLTWDTLALNGVLADPRRVRGRVPFFFGHLYFAPLLGCMKYPDIKAIVSGAFKPLDESRCLCCGKELRGVDLVCGYSCQQLMLAIQRKCSEEACSRMVANAKRNNDPRLM